MKVIVAGMSKTGTKSMNQALTRLGYKVYDVFENLLLLGEDYAKLLREGWSTEDFKRMYEDVDAIVDYPAFFFWDEIHKAFPEAQIILTVRENEDVWVRSFLKQLMADDSSLLVKFLANFSPSNRRIMEFWRTLFTIAFGVQPPGTTFFPRKACDFNHDMMKRLYRAHNAYVQHSAPKDKLLVFNCSEGWEPLCNFLGVPVPDEPFPHKNKNAELTKEMASHPLVRKIKRESLTSAGVMIAAAVVSGVAIYKYGVTGILGGLYAQTGLHAQKLLQNLHLTRK